MKCLRPMFVGMFAANVVLLVGFVSVILGLALAVMHFPVSWLGWSGAALMFAAIAARHLLARKMRPAFDRISEQDVTTVYMPLLNEGTDVWRPVEAMRIGELGYIVTENVPPGEEWAFQPGHVLRCEVRQLGGGTHLVAVARQTQ